MAFSPVHAFASDLSVGEYSVVLPGEWVSHIEEDGISAFIEEDAHGFYKSFALSLSEKVIDNDFEKAKKDFSQHFNAIERKDKSLKLVTADIVFKSKNGIPYTYFIIFGPEKNVLSFYALSSAKNRVMLISYKVYRVSENMDIWENEFKSVLDSLM